MMLMMMMIIMMAILTLCASLMFCDQMSPRVIPRCDPMSPPNPATRTWNSHAIRKHKAPTPACTCRYTCLQACMRSSHNRDAHTCNYETQSPRDVFSRGRATCDLFLFVAWSGPLRFVFVCRVVGSLAIRFSCGRVPCDVCLFVAWSRFVLFVACVLSRCVFVCRLDPEHITHNVTHNIT